MDSAAGDEPPTELVTETFGYDGGRRVSVYVPSARPEAVVFAGDGQLIAPWGATLATAGLPPTMVVGVHRTGARDELVRIGEYSPTIEPARFAAHERFFVGEVRDWIRSRFGVELPPARTAVAGVSASAELALALGQRHPDVYGVVLAASPGGGYRPPIDLAGESPTALPIERPRTYLVAGTREPFFRENATRWADALRAAGAEVVQTERDGDHGDPFWRAEFPLMMRWAFGPVR